MKTATRSRYSYQLEGHRRPSWTVALTVMILPRFRRGGDVRFVAEELKAVFDPRRSLAGWVVIPSVLCGDRVASSNDTWTTSVCGGPCRRDGSGNGTVDLSKRRQISSVAVTSRPGTSLHHDHPEGKQCQKCSSFNTKNEAGASSVRLTTASVAERRRR